MIYSSLPRRKTAAIRYALFSPAWDKKSNCYKKLFSDCEYRNGLETFLNLTVNQHGCSGIQFAVGNADRNRSVPKQFFRIPGKYDIRSTEFIV